MASDNCCALVKTTVWEESLSTLAKNWEGAESPAAVKAAATVTTVGLGRCRKYRHHAREKTMEKTKKRTKDSQRKDR